MTGARVTPQEKKRLSYLRDRRNTYGENDKSSRKNIRRSRQARHRALRRGEDLALRKLTVWGTQADDADVRFARPRTGIWRGKAADERLGDMVVRQLQRRVERAGADPTQADARVRRVRASMGLRQRADTVRRGVSGGERQG